MMRGREFADDLGLGGIAVKHGLEAVEQREPERVGVAERMEEGEDAEHAVAR